MPLPLSGTVSAGFDALEFTVTVPDFAPVVSGRKLTLTAQEAFAANVPPQLVVCRNSPDTVTPEIVAAAVPVLVIVMVRADDVVLIAWSPKASEVGFAASVARATLLPMMVKSGQGLTMSRVLFVIVRLLNVTAPRAGP